MRNFIHGSSYWLCLCTKPSLDMKYTGFGGGSCRYDQLQFRERTLLTSEGTSISIAKSHVPDMIVMIISSEIPVLEPWELIMKCIVYHFSIENSFQIRWRYSVLCAFRVYYRFADNWLDNNRVSAAEYSRSWYWYPRWKTLQASESRRNGMSINKPYNFFNR